MPIWGTCAGAPKGRQIGVFAHFAAFFGRNGPRTAASGQLVHLRGSVLGLRHGIRSTPAADGRKTNRAASCDRPLSNPTNAELRLPVPSPSDATREAPRTASCSNQAPLRTLRIRGRGQRWDEALHQVLLPRLANAEDSCSLSQRDAELFIERQRYLSSDAGSDRDTSKSLYRRLRTLI